MLRSTAFTEVQKHWADSKCSVTRAADFLLETDEILQRSSKTKELHPADLNLNFAVRPFCSRSRGGNELQYFWTLWSRARFPELGNLPSAFSPACRWLCWSSTAQSLRPRSRSIRRGVTECSTQSHRLPFYRSWNSSRSARKHSDTHTKHGWKRAGR